MKLKDMEFKTILVDRNEEDKITTITLNRARKKNTLTVRLLKEIAEALSLLKNDRKTRVVVFQGAKLKDPPEGKLPAFSAGADLTSGLKGIDITSPQEMTSAFLDIHKCFDEVEDFPKITIAAIDGYATGGGCEFICCADLRIATKRSLFASPELKLGAIPAGGGTQRLMRLIGMSRAKQMIFIGEYISAEKAYEFGLVNYLVDLSEFYQKTQELALTIAKGPTVHQKLTKAAMNLGIQAPLKVGLALERDALGLIVSTKDALEGLTAFMERREPKFKGK